MVRKVNYSYKLHIWSRGKLTYHGKQNGLPHLVDIVLFLDLEDDDSALR